MDHSSKKILVVSNEAKECPICHVRFKNNKAFASGCLHCYCYQCIQSWVQRRATCPLCRKPIEYLIKNVKSNNDYDIEEIVPPPNDNSDQEGDLELSGGSDEELQRNASTASLETDSDSSESDAESNIDESSASHQESNEDVFSSMSEHVSDDEVNYETEDENNWHNASPPSYHESDSDMFEHDSDEDISSNLPDNSNRSEGDELNESDYESDEYEATTASAISSSVSDPSDLLSSEEDQVSDEGPSSSLSNLESDDYYSSSSEYSI